MALCTLWLDSVQHLSILALDKHTLLHIYSDWDWYKNQCCAVIEYREGSLDSSVQSQCNIVPCDCTLLFTLAPVELVSDSTPQYTVNYSPFSQTRGSGNIPSHAIWSDIFRKTWPLIFIGWQQCRRQYFPSSVCLPKWGLCALICVYQWPAPQA